MISLHFLPRKKQQRYPLVENLDEAYKLADTYTSKHVQILTKNPREALKKMSHYGALFLGEKTCVSYGDKVRAFFNLMHHITAHLEAS